MKITTRRLLTISALFACASLNGFDTLGQSSMPATPPQWEQSPVEGAFGETGSQQNPQNQQFPPQQPQNQPQPQQQQAQQVAPAASFVTVQAVDGQHQSIPLISGSFSLPSDDILKSINYKGKLTCSGIPVSYGGQLNFSNEEGHFTVADTHTGTTLRIVITPTMTPVFAEGKTISHFAIPAETTASFYQLSLSQEKRTDGSPLFFWEMKETPVEKNTKIISTDLVIFAHPETIYVNTRVKHFTNYTQVPAQCILPNKLFFIIGNKPVDIFEIQKYLRFVDIKTQEKLDGAAPVAQAQVVQSPS